MPPEPSKSPGRGSGDVYFEFITFGNMVKVSAVDAASGTEVSITGPASAGQKALERTALQKLRYVMSRQRAPEPPAGPGKLI